MIKLSKGNVMYYRDELKYCNRTVSYIFKSID